MKSATWIALIGGIGIAVAAVLFINKSSLQSKRDFLKSKDNSTIWKVAIDHMTESEINVLYDFYTKYNGNIQTVPTSVSNDLLTISANYNLFT